MYRVALEAFEGPLDLLLYLVRKEEVDIYDIPIARITDEYLKYMKMMRMLSLELAGQFLVMASTLMHIKSKMLLPPVEPEEEEEEEDPRQLLIQQLLEYRKFKEAGEVLRERENENLGVFTRGEEERPGKEDMGLEVGLFQLLDAFSRMLAVREDEEEVTEIQPPRVSVAEKMEEIEKELARSKSIVFSELFPPRGGKLAIIVCFLALLELIRLKRVTARQSSRFSDITLHSGQEEAPEEKS